MIKVNLFRDKTQKVRKTAVKPAAARTGALLIVLLVLPVAAVGTWWFQLKGEVRSLTASRSRLRAENARLQEVKKEIQRYESLKVQYQSRIDVIERLKESQSGPVLLMNNVIQSIPRSSALWLTSMDQKGDRIQITGFTKHSEVIPDLLTNLSASGYFENVDLELLEDPKDTAKFQLVCTAKHSSPAE
jgi:Tfp pilus assembly protein PilN